MSEQYHIAAFALIRNGQGEVLLKLRRDFEVWDLPGGKTDPEDVLNGTIFPGRTCEREVFEEIGCTIRLTKQFGIFYTAAIAHSIPSLSYVYQAEIVDGEPDVSDEAAEFGWFSYRTLPPNAFAIHADILRQFEKGVIDRVDLRDLVKVHQRVLS